MDSTAAVTTPLDNSTAEVSSATAASQEMVDVMLNISHNSIYLMGASFVLGSLFTLFLLLVLDFVRRGKSERDY